jgi:uncharacterized cupin superfamily protein
METRKLLLKAADIDGMAGERKVHFLNPNAVRINKSLGDAVGLSQIGVHIISVEPGKASTEYHKHLYEEECVLVLSGRGTVTIEGDRYAFGKGDFVGFPRNTAAHAIVNDGDETLVCLVVGQRLPQDVSDYPNQGKRLYRNSGEWNLVDFQHLCDPRK